MSENGHDRRAAQRREEILAIATEVFFAKGFSRTSIDDVLERIGGSKRTLYRHFPGKEALFTAIVTTFSDRASNFAPTTRSGELRPLLLELGEHYLENLLSKDVVAMFRMAVAEAPHFPEVTKVVYENGPKRACELLAKKFFEYNESGQEKIDDPAEAAQAFLATLRGDLFFRVLLTVYKPTPTQVKKSVAAAADYFLKAHVSSRM
ncbi:TetR/AcrR family transcriptional regulator [Paracoccus nototheniae]|uniref:TetR/AcrR family transcriptional regulator C-terminal domain-containing protein n=1 Tax=Paracoccus nototheniae TaxID=2489002 RepID=A0ABW4DT56_9RHOB|nr:TetR/AcrR family transcriptional regulator [Paracoccus nototheniae]